MIATAYSHGTISINSVHGNRPADGKSSDTARIEYVPPASDPDKDVQIVLRLAGAGSCFGTEGQNKTITLQGGKADVSFSSQSALRVQLTAFLKSYTRISATRYFDFAMPAPPAATVAHIALEVAPGSPDSALADGKAAIRLLATVYDENHVGIPDAPIAFHAAPPAQLNPVSCKTQSDGTRQTSITSTAAGEIIVTASAGAKTATATVRFTDTGKRAVSLTRILNHAAGNPSPRVAAGCSDMVIVTVNQSGGLPADLAFVLDPKNKASVRLEEVPVLSQGGAGLASIDSHDVGVVSLIAQTGGQTSNSVDLAFQGEVAPIAFSDNAMANGTSANWIMLPKGTGVVFSCPDYVKVGDVVHSAFGAEVRRVTSTQAGPVAIKATAPDPAYCQTISMTFRMPPDGANILACTGPFQAIAPFWGNGSVFHLTGKLTDSNGRGVPDRRLAIQIPPYLQVEGAPPTGPYYCQTDRAGGFDFHLTVGDSPVKTAYAPFTLWQDKHVYDVGLVFFDLSFPIPRLRQTAAAQE